MEKYISDETLKAQQEQFSALKNYIWDAAKLADDTVNAMELSLPHIRRDDDRSRTPTAHKYWCAYFWHKISTGEEIGAGFGYDLRSWEEDSSNPNIPPWRVYIYLHQPAPHHFKVLQDTRIVCETNGWLDKYATDLPTDKSNPDTSLWLPVPKEFIRGLNEITPSANTPLLLAGAVNAFLGNLIR